MIKAAMLLSTLRGTDVSNLAGAAAAGGIAGGFVAALGAKLKKVQVSRQLIQLSRDFSLSQMLLD